MEEKKIDRIISFFIVLCLFSFAYFGGRILYSIAYKEGLHTARDVCFKEKLDLMRLYERGGKNGK